MSKSQLIWEDTMEPAIFVKPDGSEPYCAIHLATHLVLTGESHTAWNGVVHGVACLMCSEEAAIKKAANG